MKSTQQELLTISIKFCFLVGLEDPSDRNQDRCRLALLNSRSLGLVTFAGSWPTAAGAGVAWGSGPCDLGDEPSTVGVTATVMVAVTVSPSVTSVVMVKT